MADLIERVRDLVGDPQGTDEAYADAFYQDALDRNRMVVRVKPLAPCPTLQSGGNYQYLDYYADFGKAGIYGLRVWGWMPRAEDYEPLGDWEDTVLLQDSGFATVTPTTKDLQTGHWTFATSQMPPIYISGITYDLYAAAAHVCRMRAAKESINYDHDYNFAGYKESQKAVALRAMAQEFEAMRRVGSLSMERTDTNSLLGFRHGGGSGG
jgi:hypothetical protein